MSVTVKICGLSDEAGVDAAVEAGADMIGFVFYPPSPRAVTPAAAAALSARHAGGPLHVGLFVDASDEALAETLAAVPLDMIQLHGREDAARVAAVRARFGLPVMRAVGVAAREEVAAAIVEFGSVADRLLFDAKPPPPSTPGALPGGNAASFDWAVMQGAAVPVPWLLAGGLTAENVGEAIRIAGAPGVDVSSGVERARGVKDPNLIRAFIAAARAG
ncbi:phosphoribosylanthranilate isomerase [Elioraea rosea]|uniref:phosphoribosylanthranilate isomerase n=1 Tax=Elioraea rosea TaxID=2492390 RepID=UPI00118416A9|nr:phosphoribosylanthranilate isomerase [Elioraea rosea]